MSAGAGRLIKIAFYATLVTAYGGVAAGIFGFIKIEFATLVTFLACAIACVVGVVFLLLARRESRRSPSVKQAR
jgi:hypothetical protein